MQIVLYKCNSERNRINKSDFLLNSYAINGYIKSSTSVTDVVITIERSNFIPYKYNYMYISEFNRYYFITDIVSVANNLWEIHAHVDVLFSFRDDILTSLSIVDRIESGNANMYLNDGSFVMDTRQYNQIIEFPTGLNANGQYILICAGGN